MLGSAKVLSRAQSVCGQEMQTFVQNGEVVEAQWNDLHSKLVKCPCCGYMRFDPLPSAAKLEEYYGSQYWGETDARRDAEISYKPDSQYDCIAADILAAWKRTTGSEQLPRVHEVGCGLGAAVHHLNRRGADATGSDLSRESVGLANELGNHAVEVSPIDDYLNSYTGRPIEMFWLCHSLEHFIDPERELSKLYNGVADGGLVMARVPNVLHFGSRPHDITKFTWFQYPAHLHYFSPKSLAQVFSNAGFRVEEVRSTFREDLPEDSFKRALGISWSNLPDPKSILRAFSDNFLSMELEIIARKAPGMNYELHARLEKIESLT